MYILNYRKYFLYYPMSLALTPVWFVTDIFFYNAHFLWARIPRTFSILPFLAYNSILVSKPKMFTTASSTPATLTTNPQNFNPAPAPNSNITQTNYPSLSQPLTKRNETNLLLWKNQLLNVIIANWLEDFIEGDMPIPAKFFYDA